MNEWMDGCGCGCGCFLLVIKKGGFFFPLKDGWTEA